MTEINDTICAISTPPGVGGIATARISGPEAIQISDKIWQGRPLLHAKSHTAHLGTILDTHRQPLDQAIATIFRAPHSFTAQDTVEISVHGSAYIQQELIAALIAAGARLAEPGEFTRRAFIAGQFDLTQAEAIADLIASTSRAAQRLAFSQMRGSVSKQLEKLRSQLVELASLVELELDFSEEDVQFASRQHLRQLATDIHTRITRLHDSFATGQAIKNGIPTAIVGPTNAGKSSLLNALAGDDRSIVSDIHGTTRDTIEDTINLPSGHTLRLIDTAGLRHTDDPIERLGIDRSISALAKASIILAVCDTTQPHTIDPLLKQIHENAPATPTLLILNKTDLLPPTKQQAETVPLVATANSESPEQPSETASNDVTANSEESEQQYNSVPHGAIVLSISAKTGQGIDKLRQKLQQTATRLTAQADTEGIIITNARQAQALAQAAAALERALHAIGQDLSGDLLAQDIRLATHHLATLTGAITTDTLLQTIFTRFCIGK